MNWTISKKMAAMAIIVILGLGVVSGLSFRTNAGIDRTFAELERRSKEIAALDEMEMDLLRLRLGAMELLEANREGVFAAEEKAKIEAAAGRLRQEAQGFGQMVDSPEERQLAQALEREIGATVSAADQLMALLQTNAPQEQVSAADHQLDQSGEASAENLHRFITEIRSEVLKAKTAMAASIATAAQLTWVVGLVTLAILGAAFFVFARGIIIPLKKAGEMLGSIEGGRLDVRLNLSGSDEIAQMGRTLDGFADSLQREVVTPLQQLAGGDLTFSVTPRDERDALRSALQALGNDLNAMVGQIQSAGEQIACGSTQVADASQSLSQGATETASSLEEIAASMTEITARSMPAPTMPAGPLPWPAKRDWRRTKAMPRSGR